MIHVPDVRKAVEWYESIGFSVISTGEDEGEVVWAEIIRDLNGFWITFGEPAATTSPPPSP